MKTNTDVDTTITQDLFGYLSVPCLDCHGTGENLNNEDSCEECDGIGEIIIARGE
jgi:DnaJ-class molecular chaperone